MQNFRISHTSHTSPIRVAGFNKYNLKDMCACEVTWLIKNFFIQIIY